MTDRSRQSKEDGEGVQAKNSSMEKPLAKSPEDIVVLAFHDKQQDEMAVLKKVLEERSPNIKYKVKAASTDEDLYWSLKNEELPDIVLINMDGRNLPRNQIFTIIGEVRRIYPKGVIITGAYDDDAKTIVRSLECGADDYISKLVKLRNFPTDLYNIYRRTIERQTKQAQNQKSGLTLREGETMQQINERIPHIIDSATRIVFIHGEPGTGKEAVADLFNQALTAETPFIKVQCNAIDPNQMEAELLGTNRRIRAGALNDQKGLIEQANNGWLFLDNITTLTPKAQDSLLHVIKHQSIVRAEEQDSIKVSVRFLTATNEDIASKVSSGHFRLDLWQTLTNNLIYLPPLRERAEEIEGIVRHHCQTMRGGPYAITDPTINILSKLPWKEGNIRQLRNCLRAMTECHAEKVLTPTTIPKQIRDSISENSTSQLQNKKDKNCISIEWDPYSNPSFEELVDQLLIKVISQSTKHEPINSLRKLAQEIGMVRTTLSNRLKSIASKPIGHLDETKKILRRFLK